MQHISRSTFRIKARLAAALALTVMVGMPLAALAQSAASAPAKTGKAATPAQSSFDTPEAAATALADAIRAGTNAPIAAVLGKGAGQVLHSGDSQADAQARADFLAAYQQRNRIETEADGRSVLHIGETDWPLPFPIVKTGARWQFDTRAGLQQYLDRQIGANELSLMAVLDAYVQAQREYVLRDRNRNGLLEYAQRMVSSEGQHDGLYWPAAAGEPLSPMGARFALASLGKYRGTDEASQPFNGYFFRPLTAQGQNAEGGAYDYIVGTKQIGGFALIAAPARYGVSGVMTFIVNHDGAVFSKNLGRDTTAVVARIARFDPDVSWKREAQP